MRIERIIARALTGLGDVDWIFTSGPVLISCENESQQRMLGKLLQESFYQLEKPCTITTESSKGLLDVWITGENNQFHIRRDFTQQVNEFVRASTLVSEDEIEQNVSLSENLTLGDYIFRVNLQAFQQGIVVNWPKKNELVHLNQLVNNLRQGGDEENSLTKVRASLVGAQKRVSEQKGSMVLVKAEYDELRREWEAVHRQQDEERLLLIEIKNLQENEAILSERIASAQIIQKRLELLTQNPDYRELRQLQGELIQLEERIRVVESNLKTLTSGTEVEWDVIENLREECIEWASLQEQVERLTVVEQIRTGEIVELKSSIQSCRYEGLANDEDQRLRRAEEKRNAAQQELNTVITTKDELKRTQLIYSEEVARLQDYVDMAGITESDEIKIVQRERHLKQWQDSKIGSSLDRTLRKHLSGTCIEEKLASRIDQYYEGYNASNFEEFTSRLKAFREQQKLVEKVQIQIDQLQEKAGREDILRKAVQTCTQLLERAFLTAKVADLPAWLDGWGDYERKKDQLVLKNDELQLLLTQSSMEKIKLHSCEAQLREKLGAWDTPATDRDEVLAVVFKVASQLRMKDELEREIAAYSQKFNTLLGNRNMRYLSKTLEPLADLERETMVSDNKRWAELAAWQKESSEIRKQRAESEKRLRSKRKLPSLPVLEKKIETAKRQWMAYEDLRRAIDDAKVLLETSWQEWQVKFGKALNDEMKWILSEISSSLAHEMIQSELTEAKRDYFAYRMAIAQLSLGINTEAPLLFSVGDIDEGETFWVDVIKYFRKLSLTRQVILLTSDPKLGEQLIGDGWSALNMSC